MGEKPRKKKMFIFEGIKQKVMKHIKELTSLAFILLALGGLQAQETVSATGDDATGSGGSSSYTVGQVVYTTNTGSNGSLSQGVQQAYEIYTVDVSETKRNISLSIYPNPTTDILKLKVDNTEALSYQLHDLQGKLLESKAITSSITSINTRGLPRATYLIKVMSGENKVKTFKVIKN